MKANGEIPVAILSVAGFDAAAIDPSTVLLAGEFSPVYKNGEYKAALEDINADGVLDLVLHFKPDRDELRDLVVAG